ncbi:calponin-1 isoform X1 [Nematostella vectensis]|uniref:calponin-1 isoform X1 n=1 Tax=Nematostella vectensis TaxID=45351 RepID=UPI002076F7C0|nr:calponin-1 isoform X1 [Nematostella vectensis]
MSKKPWPMDRAKVVRMWIEGKTSCNFGGDTADDFQNTLKSGVVLCKLANAIQPGAIKKINNAKMNFMMMENIENFCNFVQTKGVASQYQFVTIDLFEGKNMHQVLITLNDLKNQTEKL